jgi:glycosyltransferase involved in cell wall biosynthesis
MDDRVNVLEVVGNAIVGGMEVYLTRLIEYLPAERFAVTCLVPFEGALSAALRAAGAEVLVARMPPENPSWRSIQLTASLIKTRSIDVVHAHMSNAHTLAALAGRLCAKPVLATIHGRELSMGDLEVQRLAGTHLTTVCRHTYHQALSVGVSSHQVHMIPNGVDTDRFTPNTPRGALQRELGLPLETPLVGFVGRLSPEKGPEMFIRTAWVLHQSMPEVHFAVIGTGPLKSKLEALRKTLRMESYLHFCGTRTDMPHAYPSLDVVMLTSHSEAMPLAVLEAMACGVPVVATAVGGVPELVEDGATGFLLEENDQDGLVRCAALLLADARQRQEMGRAARARAMQAFSMEHSISAIGDLITRLASRPERSAERRMSAVSSLPKATPQTSPDAKA